MSDKSTELFHALAILSKQRPFTDISIAELTKAAGVSRMYFYRHFQTFDDIITHRITTIFNRYLQLIGRHRATDTRGLATLFFQVLEPDLAAFTTLLNNGKGPLIQETFEQDLTSLIQIDVLPFAGQNDPYWQSYVSGGLSRILVVWFESEQPESPQIMGQKIAAIVDATK